MFSVLTRHTIAFRGARVLLRVPARARTSDSVSCALSVALDPSGSVRVRVTGPHVYAAINRAVERLGQVCDGRILKTSEADDAVLQIQMPFGLPSSGDRVSDSRAAFAAAYEP